MAQRAPNYSHQFGPQTVLEAYVDIWDVFGHSLEVLKTICNYRKGKREGKTNRKSPPPPEKS